MVYDDASNLFVDVVNIVNLQYLMGCLALVDELLQR